MYRVLARHFAVKGCIAWDKRVIGLGHYTRSRWEMAYLCAKGRPPKPAEVPADLWDDCPRLVRTRHPCEKPVSLLRKAVRLTTAAADELVCDPFGGIASTGVAALAEGRRFLGGELDVRHWRVGLGRLRENTAGK